MEKWEFAQRAGFDGIELRGTEAVNYLRSLMG